MMSQTFDTRFDNAYQSVEEFPLLYPRRVMYVAEGQAPVQKLHAEMLVDDPLFSIARKKI